MAKNRFFIDEEDKPYISPYFFNTKSHPGTKIVHGPSGVEYCCPYNGQIDEHGNPVGPNLHYEAAQRDAKDFWFRKKKKINDLR